MNASCLDEKGRFKSCPYRVYTDEHKAILRGQGDFTSQCFYPCIGEGCIAYHVGVCLRLAAALKEDYIVVTESLEDIYERIQSAEKRYRK